jgi:hypothetical protein
MKKGKILVERERRGWVRVVGEGREGKGECMELGWHRDGKGKEGRGDKKGENGKIGVWEVSALPEKILDTPL